MPERWICGTEITLYLPTVQERLQPRAQPVFGHVDLREAGSSVNQLPRLAQNSFSIPQILATKVVHDLRSQNYKECSTYREDVY